MPNAVFHPDIPKNNNKISLNMLEEKINDCLASIFHGDRLENIAKKTNFVQRSSSKLKGREFVQAMVLASIDPESTPLSGINDNIRSIDPKAKMTISGLRQRINNPKAYEFLKEVYRDIIESNLKPLS